MNHRLAALRQLRKTAKIKAAYDEVLARLGGGAVASSACKVGEFMPSFVLPTAEGQLIGSDMLLAEGPLVVSFFRGAWCPYCAVTLEALEAALPELQAARGTLVAMTPETRGRALAMKQARGLHYKVLVDVDLAVAMSFGIVFKLPPLYTELLQSQGTDLAERSGNPAWLLPVPATFLVQQDGVIVRSWVNIDFTQRAEPNEILTALCSLQSGGAAPL